MKNIIILFLLFCAGSVSAQNTVNRKIAQRWDKHNGSIWEGQDSVVFSYNSNGDEMLRLIENTPSVNQWSPFFRYTSTYDPQQNLQTRVAQQWTNNAWKNVTKYSYAYNGFNQETEVVYQTSNSSNAWVNTGRILNTYSGNLLVEKITFGWGANAWEPQTKQLFQYSSPTEVSVQDFYVLNNNLWEPVERRQFQYAFGQVSSIIKSVADINGNLVLQSRTLNLINGSASPPRIASSEVQRRVSTTNMWGDSLKTTYTYTNNLLTRVEKERYQPLTNAWISVSRSTYDYNAANLLEDEKKFITNGVTSTFNNQARNVYTYNANALAEKIERYVDDNNNGWALDAQDTYSYNANDSLIYNLNENFSNNVFSPNEQYFYYYDNVSVGLADYNTLFQQAVLYPNPCIDELKIRTNESFQGAHLATVYSVDGKKVWSQMNTLPLVDCSFDLAFLPKGNFILQIRSLQSNKAQQFQFTKK